MEESQRGARRRPSRRSLDLLGVTAMAMGTVLVLMAAFAADVRLGVALLGLALLGGGYFVGSERG